MDQKKVIIEWQGTEGLIEIDEKINNFEENINSFLDSDLASTISMDISKRVQNITGKKKNLRTHQRYNPETFNFSALNLK